VSGHECDGKVGIGSWRRERRGLGKEISVSVDEESGLESSFTEEENDEEE
jgi:hypothetical protein